MNESSPHHVLELVDIVKTYGSAEHPVKVLKGCDLAVGEGEFCAIVGPSGSGKSTLLNIIGCLDRPTAGRYLLGGEDVARADDLRLSRIRNQKIGFVFQSFQLVPHLTVIENVELPLFYQRIPRARRRARCLELIDRVGLSHRIDHLPSEMSGGENQRAAVARALSADPTIVLADEPTGNLDSSTSAEIMHLFESLHDSGRTIIMITHDPEIAAAAPRRVVLRDGIIESDSRVKVGTIG